MRKLCRSLAVYAALIPLVAAGLRGQENKTPAALEGVSFEQRLGEPIAAHATFLDENGAEVRIADYLGDRPLVLAMVYYECPMLCTLVLNGLTNTLQELQFNPGDEFDVLAVSFDPGETPALAAGKKKSYVERYGRTETADGFHFLTGSQESISQVTESIGFRYVYDPETDEYAHASGIVIITPEGRVARYYYGIEYSPRDVRLGLVEAADEKIGSAVDEFLLYCFQYDPSTGTYTAVVMRILRLAGFATIILIGLFLALTWARERRQLTSGKAA